MNNTCVCISEHDISTIIIPCSIASFTLLIMSCVLYRFCLQRRRTTREELPYTRQN